MLLYHIDRENKLKLGETYSLFHFNDLDPDTIRCVESLFPEGVSWWGDAKLLCTEARLDNVGPIQNDTIIDMLFELIRKAYFSDKPSRYQSMFALETPSLAREFITQMRWPISSKIWEVESDTFIKVNMNLLHLRGRPIDLYQRAFAYWNGEIGEDQEPCWEFLLKYPVRVNRLVE